LVSHGRKFNKFGIPCPQVYAIVENSGLLPLCRIAYEVLDKGLITTFVERWYQDTNSFHLPVGEMTITLDDVSSILHLPIVGQFPTYDALNHNVAKNMLMELLGTSETNSNEELRRNKGAQVRLTWLREVYKQCCIDRSWECAARAYLLHLLGCTIFANKSATWVSVCYLALFRDLDMCGQWAWGAAALTFMYKQLGDACLSETRQLGGFLTIVQV